MLSYDEQIHEENDFQVVHPALFKCVNDEAIKIGHSLIEYCFAYMFRRENWFSITYYSQNDEDNSLYFEFIKSESEGFVCKVVSINGE